MYFERKDNRERTEDLQCIGSDWSFGDREMRQKRYIVTWDLQHSAPFHKIRNKDIRNVLTAIFGLWKWHKTCFTCTV
jgi:hypothetical protein